MNVLKTNAHWFKLNEHQQTCMQAGLPLRYLGTNYEELQFERYIVGNKLTGFKAASAHNQRRALAKFIREELRIGGNYTSTILLHSSPTGDAALALGTLIAEKALMRKMDVGVPPINELNQLKWIDERPREVYLIHLVTSGLPAADYIRIRNFLNGMASGSLAIVVAATDGDISKLINQELRFKFDYRFCLVDVIEEMSVDSSSTVDSSNAPVALPVARRLNHKTTSA